MNKEKLRKEAEDLMVKLLPPEKYGECSDVDNLMSIINELASNKSESISGVIPSALSDEDRMHYDSLKECCTKLLKSVDEGKAPKREIMGLKILLPSKH